MKESTIREYVIEAHEYRLPERKWFPGAAREKAGRHPLREAYAVVTDRWGKQRDVSKVTYQVGAWLSKQAPGFHFTQRKVADSLGVNASSVNRALTLLEAFGLVAIKTERGRYGGTWLVVPKQKSWRQRAKEAWAKIKRRADQRYFAYLRRWVEQIPERVPLFGYWNCPQLDIWQNGKLST